MCCCVAIDHASYQSKNQLEKNYSSVFFVLFTRPALSSGIYGTLLPLILLMTTAKKERLLVGIHVYSGLRIALRIPTALDFCVIRTRKLAYAHTQQKKFPSS